MILNRLTLFNYGVYRGEKTFNLRPESGRPIVIVGGKNGAGKTTLLDAIRLCLYGRLALDQNAPPDKAAYEAYLRRRIHHIPDTLLPIDTARLELEFEYALAGERRKYIVKREWQNSSNRVKETLQVFEDEQALAMDAAQWQDFLKDLIPPGLSQLFFFDGEKIQSLADGERKNTALSRAVKALLGLNIVEQLHTDLALYRRRQQKGNKINAAERQIEQLEDELAQVGSNLQAVETDHKVLIRKSNGVEQKIELQEAEIARLGGGFAQQRANYKAAQIRLEAEIEQVEQNIRDLCAGLLPFAIASDYTAAVKDRLLLEVDYQQWEASRTFIERRLARIRSEIEGDQFWQGTGAEALTGLRDMVGKKVVKLLQKMVEPPENLAQTTLLHQVSPPEQRQLLHWIEESQQKTPQQLQQLSSRLSELKRERWEATEALRRVPADDVLAPLVETLNALNQELGAIRAQQAELEQKQRRQRLKQDELRRKLHRAKEKQSQNKDLSNRIKLVVDVDLALDDFAARLTDLRVKQLSENFTRNFNHLARKERLIEKAAIDRTDFSVSLIREDGQTTPKKDLSAGEKQIYAIAMLWALRQVSGRPLPVIIDTPLGRLDSDHRRNLIERYFPHASHQVILFSTDTEVDLQLFAALQPHIARTYRLRHDDEKKATVVSEGYFWSSNGKETQ